LPQRYSVTGGNGLPGDGSPTLILDFIGGGTVPSYTLDLVFAEPISVDSAGASLLADFIADSYRAPDSDMTGTSYSAFQRDPSAPQTFATFQAWS